MSKNSAKNFQKRLLQAGVLALLAFVTATQARGADSTSRKHRIRRTQYTRNPLRTITGTVRDQGDEPLRGAVVQIKAEDTLVIQSYVTDDRGIYHFRNLRPDADFEIWATFRGHHSKHHAVSKFDHDVERTIPLLVDLNKD
jgi:hypothetical protein